MKLIGIFGSMNSGKDTAAGALVDYADYATQPLAAPMKAFAREVFGFSDEQLYGPSESRNAIDPHWGISARQVLQNLGTEFGRAQHEDVWIEYALNKVRHWGWGGAVIPDVRYENEIRKIQEFGGVVVKVFRPGRERTAFMNHASEMDQLRIEDSVFDAVIINDGTVKELREKMLAFEKSVKPVEERR